MRRETPARRNGSFARERLKSGPHGSQRADERVNRQGEVVKSSSVSQRPRIQPDANPFAQSLNDVTPSRHLLGAAASIATLMFLGAAIHELVYRHDHPHAAGPAGVLAVLGIAGALVSAAVAVAAYWNDDVDFV